MTGSTWSDLESSTIRLRSMVTVLQIGIEQLGLRDPMVTDLLALVRDSLGTEISTIEGIWDGMRRQSLSRRKGPETVSPASAVK